MHWMNAAVGLLGGSILAAFFVGLDAILKRFTLITFNSLIWGLFMGVFITNYLRLSLYTLRISPTAFAGFPFLICSTTQ